MKKLLPASIFSLAAIVLVGAVTSSAQAQSYPWCAVLNVGDLAWNCGFVTREQCMASVSGIGGFCQPNNQYAPARPVRRH